MRNDIFIILLAVSAFLMHSPSTGYVDHSTYETVSECIECHPRALPTHRRQEPSHMTESLPLDDEGRMLCVTCHDCIRGMCELRKDAATLCNVCHDCSQGMACLIETVHLGDSPDLKTLSVNGCLSCHDGAIGPSRGGPGEHKVDILYIASKEKKLWQVTDKKVVFVEGRVTCISCHNPYKSEIQRLVKSNSDSRLCLTCHQR
jgi:predicted CXXCH cytochrome family protein